MKATDHLMSGTRAADASGLTYRQVDYLASSGVVAPTRKAKGSGSSRGYDIDDLALLIVWRDVYRVFGKPAAGIAGSREIVKEAAALLGVVDTAVVKKGTVRFEIDLAAARREATKRFAPMREERKRGSEGFRFDNAPAGAA